MAGEVFVRLLCWMPLVWGAEGIGDSRPSDMSEPPPVGPTRMIVKAQTALERERYAESLSTAEFFLQMYREDPRAGQMRFIRAASLVRLGRGEEGAEALRAAIAENPKLKDRPDVQELMADGLGAGFETRLEAEARYLALLKTLEARTDGDPAALVWMKLAYLYIQHRRWPAVPGGEVPASQPEQLRVMRELALHALDRAALYSQTPIVYGKVQLMRARFLAGKLAPEVNDAEAALAAYAALLEKAGDTDVAPDALYESALLLEAKGNYVVAARRYERLVDRFPDSAQREDADRRLQVMLRPLLVLRSTDVSLPGREPEVHWIARNVPRIALRAFKVDLFELLRDIGSPQHLSRWQGGTEMARWDMELPDNGTHQHLASDQPPATPIRPPLRESGAYVIEATAGDIRVRTLVVVSAIRAIVKAGKGGSVLWVVDSLSGSPVAEADVLAQRSQGPRGYSYEAGKTDGEGLWASGEPSSGKTSLSRFVATAARRGDDYAMISESFNWHWWGYPRPLRVYGFTDSPVYQPGQTVCFKQIVRFFKEGLYENRPGRPVKILVRDPRGAVVHEHADNANEFGGLPSTFVLSTEAEPGLYQIEVVIGSQVYGPRETGSNRFRVVTGRSSSSQPAVTPIRSEPATRPVETGIDEEHYADPSAVGVRVLTDPKERKIRVLLSSSRAEEAVWLTGQTDDVLFSRVARLQTGAAEVDLPVTAELSPNFHLCATSVQQNEIHEVCRQVLVPPAEPILSITLDGVRDSYPAGQKAEFRILARDSQGRPVAADVALFMADAAVWDAQRGGSQSIESFFHGDLRPQLVRTYTGHEFLSGRTAATAPVPGVSVSASAPARPSAESRPRRQPAPEAPVMVSAGVAASGVWIGSVQTQVDGTASVTVTMPQANNTWRLVAVAVDQQTRVGHTALAVATK